MMIDVERINVLIGRAQILFDISFEAAAGEAVVLAGRNGAGKSTTIKAVMGLLPMEGGRVRLDGERVDGKPSWQVARAGIGYVPEERRIFTELTVLENLEVGRLPARPGLAAWTPARLFDLFPALASLAGRRGRHLSGGEQQMLAIARTLMGNPRCLLLDEPTEGLAPIVVEQLARAFQSLKREGLALVLSEQNLRFAAQVADRAYVIERGMVRHQASMKALLDDPVVAAGYLAL
jgi:branched-chain amino acid transport system ATP-binding protein